MRRSNSRWRSETPPGSYSIVVTPTVAPIANTVTSPRSTPLVATIRATPSVRSTMWPLPGVCRRSIPPPAAIAPLLRDLHAREAALAHLQHAAVEILCGHVQDVARHRLAVEPDRALGQAPARLRGRDAERLRQQRGQVHARRPV